MFDEADFDFALEAFGVEGAPPALADLRVISHAPIVKIKSTKDGPVYRIKGYFEVYNNEVTPSSEFQVGVYHSADPFFQGFDPLIQTKLIRKPMVSGDKRKKVKYKIKTTQYPFDGSVIAVADSAGQVLELTENNNRAAVQIDTPAP